MRIRQLPSAALLAAFCLAGAGCGGGDDSAEVAGSDGTTDRPAARQANDLPSSLDFSEYNRLRDALDMDEVPRRIVPRLPADERLSFATAGEVRDDFIEAIADADFQQADRIFASADDAQRYELLDAADDAARDTYRAGDYAQSYRFDRYLNLDNSALWMLDGDYIGGRVTDTGTGEPVAGATVATEERYGQAMQTGADGRYRLLIPANAPVGLVVEHPDYDLQRVWQTETGGQISLSALNGRPLDIRLGTGLPRLTFRGRLVDAETDEPLGGFPVVAGFEPIEGKPEVNLQMVMGKYARETDADGRFEITDLPVQTVQLLAQSMADGKVYQLQQTDFTFEEGVEHVIEIRGRGVNIELPMVVVGTVKDRSSGEPIANARVSAGGWKAERTGADGRFLIQLKTGQDWELTASHEAYRQSQPQPFSAAAPKRFETEFLLDAITTGTVLGTAINAATGEPIANAVIEIAGREVRTDSRGRFRAEEIESGEVTVSGAQSGYRADSESMLLEALQTAEATLELEPITTGTINGSVVEEGSAAALAGVAVRAGDSEAVTGDDGRFVLEDVEAGAVAVAATKALYVPGSSNVALEAMATAETRIELTPITWGTVRGSVRDATSGRALANARVRIGAVEVATDADGNYVAERVPAGEISISAGLERYHGARAQIELPRDGDVSRTLELAPITTGTVYATVTDAASGEPVAGARVLLGTRPADTDATGRVAIGEVAAGRVAIRVSANLYEPGSAEAVLEAAGETRFEIALTPVTYGTVTGTVVSSADDTPLANATVSIAGRELRADEQGAFRAERVPAGSVSVSAGLLRHRGDRQTVELERGGERDLRLRLEPITTGTVRGVVRNAVNGQPIGGATVTAGNRSALSDAGGRFEIEQVAAGGSTVRASFTLFEPGESRVDVAAAGTVDTDIRLTPITYGTVSGTVVDADSGEPLGGAMVSAARQSTRTDAAGRFELERIAAGDVSVTASRPVYLDDSTTLALTAGDSETVTLRLQAITWGTVSGIVVDADTGRPLANAEIAVGTQALSSGADGRFRAEKIAAGPLRIGARAPAYEPASVTADLQPDSERDVRLSLTPIKIGAIRGRVLDAKTGEPVARARVTTSGQAAETDGGGNFSFGDVATGNTVVAARHPDYANGSASADVLPADTVDVVVRLDLRREDVTNLEAELAKSGTIDLYGIYFDSGKAEFRPSSLSTLRAVLEVMKRAPGRRFRIAGHTDSDGGDDYNQNLSDRRAATVIRWLTDNGIDAARLEGTGFGETRPAAPNDTESGKALNRRVQLSFAN